MEYNKKKKTFTLRLSDIIMMHMVYWAINILLVCMRHKTYCYQWLFYEDLFPGLLVTAEIAMNRASAF